MPLSLFEQLADRFKAFESYRKGDDIRINKLMERAGECLFRAIERGEIRIADVPDWFVIEPTGRETAQVRKMRAGEDPADYHAIVDWYYWDMYWWTAVKWMARNIRDSAIDVPSPPIGGEQLRQPSTPFDISVVTRRQGKKFRKCDEVIEARAWRYVVSACTDACRHLARIHESATANETTWLTANEAVTKYGIAKSTLSKISKRNPLVRRPATEAEKQRHGNDKIQYMYDARILYEYTEARPSDTRLS